MNRVKGTDITTERNQFTIIDGECSNCGEDFTFDPNNCEGNTPIDGATYGNWKVMMDEQNRPRKYAVCPYCGNCHETDIFI